MMHQLMLLLLLLLVLVLGRPGAVLDQRDSEGWPVPKGEQDEPASIRRRAGLLLFKLGTLVAGAATVARQPRAWVRTCSGGTCRPDDWRRAAAPRWGKVQRSRWSGGVDDART